MMRSLRALPFCLVLLLLTGCTISLAQGASVSKTVGPLPLEGATQVDVNITLSAAELLVHAVRGDTISAELSYDAPMRRPTVDYAVIDDRGKLVVEQPQSTSQSANDDRHNRAELWLPLDELATLDARLGAGRVDLDLRGATPSEVNVRMGAGAVELDLRGQHSRDMKVSLGNAVGSTTVLLPKDMNITVNVHGALDPVRFVGLTSDGYTVGPDAPTLTLDVSQLVGAINLRRAD